VDAHDEGAREACPGHGDFRLHWVDSHSPYLFFARGKEKDGAVHYTGRAPEPMTGRMEDTYGVMTWVDEDTYTYETGKVLEDGTRQRTGLMTYKRRKK